jgi:hypothetical protein
MSVTNIYEKAKRLGIDDGYNSNTNRIGLSDEEIRRNYIIGNDGNSEPKNQNEGL